MMRAVVLFLVISVATQAFHTPLHTSLKPKYNAQNQCEEKHEMACGTHSRGHGREGSVQTKLDMALYPVSGVDSLPVIQQQVIFAGILLGLGVGTTGLRAVFDTVENALPKGWFANWRSTWPLLGAVYVLAGVAHFGVQDAFVSIFPPQGTWGLWYLPGSAEFHVAWTGIAEFLGGAGLLGGAFCSSFVSEDDIWVNLTKVSAASLALLTVVVSPANIYMYTHGAIMVGAGPDGPVELQFHMVRFVAQIVLLSLLTGIATAPSQGENTGSTESINDA